MRALVLQGGGAKGAYQTGAVKHLMGELEIDYDIVCGISVGAINGAWVAQTPRGKERQAASELEKLWLSIDNRSIRKKWCLWPLSALWKPSIYDSRPLHKLLHAELDPEKIATSGRMFRAGAVSLTTGAYRCWRESDPDIVEGVLASSAFPGGLIPVKVGQSWYTDGGVRDQTPLNEAIQLGATTCDVILLSSNGVKQDQKKPRTLNVLTRALDIVLDELVKNDLEKAELYNQLVIAGQCPGKRRIRLNVLTPSHPLGSTLDFDSDTIRANIARGYDEARTISWT